jgi:hypothetical protein
VHTVCLFINEKVSRLRGTFQKPDAFVVTSSYLAKVDGIWFASISAKFQIE